MICLRRSTRREPQLHGGVTDGNEIVVLDSDDAVNSNARLNLPFLHSSHKVVHQRHGVIEVDRDKPEGQFGSWKTGNGGRLADPVSRLFHYDKADV